MFEINNPNKHSLAIAKADQEAIEAQAKLNQIEHDRLNEEDAEIIIAEAAEERKKAEKAEKT